MTVEKVAQAFAIGSQRLYDRSMSNPIFRAKSLYDKGSREAILDFLQEMDPNGSYTDRLSYDEGLDLLTYDEALLYLEEVIQELEAVPA